MSTQAGGPPGTIDFPDGGKYRTLSGKAVQTHFMGCNGAVKCSGVIVDVMQLTKGSIHDGFGVNLSPVTGRGVRGSCYIDLPPDPAVLRRLAGALHDAANKIAGGNETLV